MHKIGRKILLSVSIGAIIYIAFAIWADYKSLIVALQSVNWLYIPVVLALIFINYIFRFFKWDYYLKILNINISKKDSFLIFFSGLSMSITPGKMGELLKCYLLKKINQTSMSYSSSVIIAERITDFISLIVIALIGAYYINYGREIIIIFGLLFFMLIFVLSSKRISLRIISIFEKIKRFGKIIKKVHIAYESIYNLVKIKPLIYSTIISFIGWCSECFGVFLIIKSFNVEFNVSLLTSSFIYAFSTLIGALMFLPGGLGVTDGSLVGLLVILGGFQENYAVIATFLTRAATLWFAVILGSILLLYYQRRVHLRLTEIENIEKDN